jgi:hypothetical protein
LTDHDHAYPHHPAIAEDDSFYGLFLYDEATNTVIFCCACHDNPIAHVRGGEVFLRGRVIETEQHMPVSTIVSILREYNFLPATGQVVVNELMSVSEATLMVVLVELDVRRALVAQPFGDRSRPWPFGHSPVPGW